MYPLDTYPKDTYPPVTYPLDTYPLDTYPLDTYPLGHIPPGHLPPRHLPPGHLPPRTYTPQDIYPYTLKCPIWFMHHVLITYCTLKSIYFAGIAFVCDAGALMLSDICSVRNPHNYSGFRKLGGRGELCPCHMSILISILLGFHVKI